MNAVAPDPHPALMDAAANTTRAWRTGIVLLTPMAAVCFWSTMFAYGNGYWNFTAILVSNACYAWTLVGWVVWKEFRAGMNRAENRGSERWPSG